MLWYHENDLSTDDEANSVYPTLDGGYLVAGVTYSVGNYDFNVLKTDSTGFACANTNCNMLSQLPKTKQTTQDIQTYTSSNAFNYIPTSMNTALIPVSVICVTGIQDFIQNTNTLVVFPNPNNGLFTFSFNNSNIDKIKISIKNIFGEIVYTSTNQELSEINLQQLPGGSYFLQIQSLNKNYSQKIIIVK